jgi:uncharacterized membrane protein YdjX (TVP38/TMEM64 family)
VRSILRPVLLIAIVLMIPVVPFVLWGGELADWTKQWLVSSPRPGVTAAVVFALLAADIFAPIPSSLVNTLAGSQLGWLMGLLVCWAGMTAGAVLGYVLARTCGPLLARRMAARREYQEVQRASHRWGAVVLVATRGLPVLAEASVLWAGLERLPLPTFLLAILTSNLALAAVYSACGSLAARYEWLPGAVIAAVVLPVVMTLFVRRKMRSTPAA